MCRAKKHHPPQTDAKKKKKKDEKANVRRNAVPALEALLKLSPAFAGSSGAIGGGAIGKEYEADFMLLQDRCNDVSLSTRKVGFWEQSTIISHANVDRSTSKKETWYNTPPDAGREWLD